ncbi:type I methionyl aminopeptidase [Planctomycetales bacterium ZRK34]|nr:type I methionyl aminopeptidase [Planctomycetales bacterium ZRK34]
MAISLKSPEQIKQMRHAGQLVRQALERCRAICQPGVTTAEIDAEAGKIIAENPGSVGLFKWYPTYHEGEGFPAFTCISVNDEVVHGIPGPRVIQDGDLVSVDFGVRINGWCGDSATTIMVGSVKPEHKKLCAATEYVLQLAIDNIRPGRKWSQVARLMQRHAEDLGLGVIRDFVGHGIGETMHQDPKVPNFVSRELLRNDIDLEPGLVLAVEPMCTLGTDQVRTLDDGWTVVTMDGKPAAHYEHTIAVTETGCEVLTGP